MIRSINNIPIFRRLFIAFSLTAFTLGLIIVLLVTSYLNTLNMLSQAVKISFDAQNTASQEEANLQRMNALLETRFAQIYASKGNAVDDPSLKASGDLIEQDIQARELEFDQVLQGYMRNYAVATSSNMKGIRTILLSGDARNTAIINEQQNALDQVIDKQQWKTYAAAQNHVLALLRVETTPYADAYEALFQARQAFLPLSINWKHVANVAVTIGTTVTSVGPAQIRPIIGFTLAAIISTLLIIIVAGYLINATITQRLRNLVQLTRRIEGGDTSARASIEGRDEIQQVAKSMNSMLDHIVQLIQEARNRHTDLQAQIEKLISEVSGIGEGDLRIQAEVTSDELGPLAQSFNLTAEQLNNLVVNVKTLARGVQSAALQTFGHVEKLADDADTQMQQIKTAQVELSSTANASLQVAERMRTLHNASNDGRQLVQKGRNAVKRSVESTQHISEHVHLTTEKVLVLGDRSRAIHDIVEVISTIAQQTNRLALDAAIQAAMAGDRGNGFGAVAIDIRRLAELAKVQTIRIENIVRSVLEDIDTATASVQQAEREVETGTVQNREVGEALEAIFSIIERQAGEIAMTNQLATRQLQSSHMIAKIVQQITQTTIQTSSSTREVTQQMKNLAQLAGLLLGSVDVFKLREHWRSNVVEVSPVSPLHSWSATTQRYSGSPAVTTSSADQS